MFKTNREDEINLNVSNAFLEQTRYQIKNSTDCIFFADFSANFSKFHILEEGTIFILYNMNIYLMDKK